MRTVELNDGSSVSVRGMKRKEIRECSDFGVGYASFRVDPSKFDDFVDKLLGYQFSDDVLDEMGNADQMALFKAVMAETYGDNGEEKNLPTSGPGDQTKPESSDAENAESGQIS